MTDLRNLLDLAAPTPMRDVDVDALLARAAKRRRTWRRLALWCAAAIAVGAGGVGVNSALSPAGPSQIETTPGVRRPAAVTTSTLAPTAVAGSPDVRGRATPSASNAPSQASAHASAVARNGRLAYMGTDGIHVAEIDGSQARLVAPGGLDPDWSPDGSKIAFWKGSGDVDSCRAGGVYGSSKAACTGDIWIMDADGSHQHQVISGGMQPDWAPDGRQLAFATTGTNVQIAIAHIDGSGRRDLTEGANVHRQPAWSPDGSRIAYTQNDTCSGGFEQICLGLFVKRADGVGGATRLAGGPDGMQALFPAWSPDGTRLAFTGYQGDNDEIYVLTFGSDGVHRERLTHDAASSDNPFIDADIEAAWSADGTKIFYTHDPDGPSGAYVCGGSPPRVICGAGGPQPGSIYVMNADGSSQHRLVGGVAAAASGA
jgi:dipeptidyl aminopeptidase/acylaminoacyl peptidase